MMRNNALNKVHVAATELPQLLSQNTKLICLERQPRKVAVRLCAALKLTELEMWANAQRDGRPAEHRWRPLFNAAEFG